MNWIRENWLLILIIAALIAYSVFKRMETPLDQLYDDVKHLNDSIEEVNEKLQIERDSIDDQRKIDSTAAAEALTAVDSLEKVKIKTKIIYYEARDAIYNSTDAEFIQYISTREVPAGYMEE